MANSKHVVLGSVQFRPQTTGIHANLHHIDSLKVDPKGKFIILWSTCDPQLLFGCVGGLFLSISFRCHHERGARCLTSSLVEVVSVMRDVVARYDPSPISRNRREG